MAEAVAVLAASCAVWLALAPAAGNPTRARVAPPWWLLAGPAFLLPWPWLVPVVALGLLGARLVWRRLAARRAREATSLAVLESCELLAAELAAGRPPGAALDLAARQWPPLRPVAEAFALGSHVPTALRGVARAPGADGLRLVAAAWEVAEGSGQRLARTVDRVARGIASRRRTRRVVESELASARATARLVAVLPVGALAMGSGAGGDPWAFLLATPVGLGCLVGGVVLVAGGLLWIEVLADRAAPP